MAPASHLGVLVEVHAGVRGDVLGADDLTVSLKGLELEELGRRQQLQGEQKRIRKRPEAARSRSLSPALTSMTSVLRMCNNSVPPQYRYCITS